jgi:DNA-binding transcriptional regulator of glucitol operon
MPIGATSASVSQFIAWLQSAFYENASDTMANQGKGQTTAHDTRRLMGLVWLS